MLELQNVFLYMELRGIRYDRVNANRMLEETSSKLKEVSARLTATAGKDLTGKLGSLSPKKLIEALYVDKGYPPQYAKDGNRKSTELTTDVEAILSLKRSRLDDTFLSEYCYIATLKASGKRSSIIADPDHRVRCGYSLEAETGRVKCYKVQLIRS